MSDNCGKWPFCIQISDITEPIFVQLKIHVQQTDEFKNGKNVLQYKSFCKNLIAEDGNYLSNKSIKE